MFSDAECLVIAAYGQDFLGSVRAVPKLETVHGGSKEEVLAVSELLAQARYKELTSMVSYSVKGPGKLVKVWVDDEKVSHSKEFYLTLMEDFMKQCRTPAGECCELYCLVIRLVCSVYTHIYYVVLHANIACTCLP